MATTDLEKRVEFLEANLATKDDLESAIFGLLETIEGRFEKMEGRFEGIESRLGEVERRTDNMEGHLAVLARLVSLNHDELKSVNDRLRNVEHIVLETDREIKRRPVGFNPQQED